MAVSYFSFEDLDGTFRGLVRRTKDASGLSLERVDKNGNWVEDTRELFRYFVDPGTDFIPVSDEKAAALAEQFGASL